MGSHIGQWITHHMPFLLKYLGGGWFVVCFFFFFIQLTGIWMVLTDWSISVSIDAFVFLIYLAKDWTELINVTENYSTVFLIFFKIFFSSLNQVQGNNLSLFLTCTLPSMHTILFQLFGFCKTCGQKHDEHQNEYGMSSSGWTNKQGYCSMQSSLLCTRTINLAKGVLSK